VHLATAALDPPALGSAVWLVVHGEILRHHPAVALGAAEDGAGVADVGDEEAAAALKRGARRRAGEADVDAGVLESFVRSQVGEADLRG